MNTHPFSSEDYVRSFVREIAACREDGYYFVPILGAGLSVPSGIPQAPMLTRYMTWCFLRILGLNPWAVTLGLKDKIANPRSERTWTPRSNSWPDMAVEIDRHQCNPCRPDPGSTSSLSTPEMDQVLIAAVRILEDGGSIKDSAGNPGVVQYSAELVREVYGALADWRTALQLLSRIAYQESGFASSNQRSSKSVILTAPDESVIDSFFQTITEGKQPNQGHRMITALAPILRMSVLLTPNFDDLLEKAFSAIRCPLKVFEVPHEVPLPDARLVTRQRSLVKIHGGSFGLRADYTIDAEPDTTDSTRFLGYLAGRPVRPALIKDPAKKVHHRAAILLCGISGKDQRVLAMLHLALSHFDNLRIFWFCYSERDVVSVKAHFGTQFGKVAVDEKTLERGRSQIIAIRHIDYGALLHQIYQGCTNSIPAAGLQFPAAWNLSTAPRISPPPGKPYRNLKSAVESELRSQLRARTRQPILVPFYPKMRGGITLLSDIYWSATRLAGQKRSEALPYFPVWIDLYDVATPAGVFLRLALALSRITGISNPVSSLPLSDFYHGPREEITKTTFYKVLWRALKAHHARTGECLLVCLNAQEAIGVHSPFTADSEQRKSTAHLEAPATVGRHGWTTESFRIFVDILVALNRSSGNGIQFLLVAKKPDHPSTEVEGNLDLVFRHLTQTRQNQLRIVETEPHASMSGDSFTTFDPDTVAQSAVQWAVEDEKPGTTLSAACYARLAFLRLLVGFRFSPFEAGLVRIAQRLATAGVLRLLPASSVPERVKEWIRELADLNVVRWKVGGAIWIHGAVRQRILDLAMPYRLRPADMLLVESLIARWYGRLLLATSDPLAATESAYHAFGGISRWLQESRDRSEGLDAASSSLAVLIACHVRGVIATARTVLEEQLSDQFADHTLVLTQSSVQVARSALLSAVRTDGDALAPEAWSQLSYELDRCNADTAALRIHLYLQEGEFATVIKHASTREGSLRAALPPGSVQDCMAALDVATALFCLRDYAGADRAFGALWKEIVGSDVGMTNWPNCESGAEAARVWIARAHRIGHAREADSGLDWDGRVKVVVRLCRRHVYLRLLQALSVWLDVEERDSKVRGNNRCVLLREAFWIGEFGVEVLRSIASTEDRFVFEENVRVRAHCALVKAILGWHEVGDARKAHYQEALNTLSDGESFIEEFPLPEGKVGRIIVELRRAEILIIHTGEGEWLSEAREQLEFVARTFDGEEQDAETLLIECAKEIDAIRERTFPEGGKGASDLESRIAVVYDAMRYLERCEIELRAHPKNRWWLWILLVLKVHAAEGLFMLRLMVPRHTPADLVQATVISFLEADLEQQMECSALVDPFQIARILRSYRRLVCSQRIHHWRTERARGIAVDGASAKQKTQDLETRFVSVFTRLANALSSAMEARQRDQELPPMESRVQDFCDKCLIDAADMARWDPGNDKERERLDSLRSRLPGK